MFYFPLSWLDLILSRVVIGCYPFLCHDWILSFPVSWLNVILSCVVIGCHPFLCHDWILSFPVSWLDVISSSVPQTGRVRGGHKGTGPDAASTAVYVTRCHGHHPALPDAYGQTPVTVRKVRRVVSFEGKTSLFVHQVTFLFVRSRSQFIILLLLLLLTTKTLLIHDILSYKACSSHEPCLRYVTMQDTTNTTGHKKLPKLQYII